MHTIEPYYNWRDYYIASDDDKSPFFGVQYNEFQFHKKIYNYFIHPQWDDISSNTLYVKVLFIDYINGSAIIELIGEWNDAINNDIMLLKRNLIDSMIEQNIYRFVLVGENILNFHGEDYDYYAEWAEDVSDDLGWMVCLNLREHVVEEMKSVNIHHYMAIGKSINLSDWRTMKPHHLIQQVEGMIIKKLI